jgi:hypothetical protein
MKRILLCLTSLFAFFALPLAIAAGQSAATTPEKTTAIATAEKQVVAPLYNEKTGTTITIGGAELTATGISHEMHGGVISLYAVKTTKSGDDLKTMVGKHGYELVDRGDSKYSGFWTKPDVVAMEKTIAAAKHLPIALRKASKLASQ